MAVDGGDVNQVIARTVRRESSSGGAPGKIFGTENDLELDWVLVQFLKVTIPSCMLHRSTPRPDIQGPPAIAKGFSRLVERFSRLVAGQTTRKECSQYSPPGEPVDLNQKVEMHIVSNNGTNSKSSQSSIPFSRTTNSETAALPVYDDGSIRDTFRKVVNGLGYVCGNS